MLLRLLGIGTCVRECPFDAMYMGEDGLPKIDDSKCTGCGKCVSVCPRHLLALRSAGEPVNVVCCSKAPIPKNKQDCQAVCIGCQICVKNCPAGAISMDGTVAVIDNSKCTKCGICVQKCPAKCIHNLFGPGSDLKVEAQDIFPAAPRDALRGAAFSVMRSRCRAILC